MKRLIGIIMGLVVVLASGCSNIPTTGPVEEVPYSPQPRGIDIAPEPPAEGVTPIRLVEGFLQAMADPAEDYAVARQYLTTDAASQWDPETAQVVLTTVTTEAEGGVRVEGDLLGELDDAGRLTSAYRPFTYEFGLVREDGEWRIGTAPEGLLLSRYIFERYYSHVPLYFMSRAGTHVVPDLRHVPEALLTPTWVVDALLDGSSPQLVRTVSNAFPSNVTLGPDMAKIDSQGVVTVDLLGLDTAMTGDARRALGAQLIWSLTSIPRVTGLVITQGGVGFALPGSNAAGVLELAGQLGYQVLSRGATPNLYGIREGVPGRVSEEAQFVPLTPQADGSADVAVSLDGVSVAYVDESRTGLSLGQLGGQVSPVKAEFTNLRAPQFALGALWLLGDGTDGVTRLLTLDRSEHVVAVGTTLPEGAVVEAFAVSPTRARLALVVRSGQVRTLSLTAVLPSGTETDGSWPLHMVSPRGSEITDVTAVSWQSETALAFIGSSASGRSVFLAQSDGSLVEDLGPVVGDVAEITAMARLGGGSVAIRNEAGMVWRFEARTRWNRIIEDISAISFGA
ncbi:MAG: GerMN domain-containing protein [Tessaracoccus sp.]|uniref:GerMN domain-containing protein n=1 Tax=Tessaracoccus sp. TaxID=1971211 RepID=UPI001ED14EAC|nr:GerMN domain-containing protein [Tessaracoccus sp.]MBK7820379.1 GerMN domain-containing protein [Tessaracoccus sp.]